VKVLVGCEFSGVVRRAFRDRGHDAWSCDILPAADESPFHIQGDLLGVLNQGWDLAILHPPCTYLCNSGVMWLHRIPSSWKQLEDGAAFFRACLEADIDRVAVENPIMHKHALTLIGGIRPYQIIQPWMFGHMEQKATCIWRKNLPELVPTNDVRAAMLKLPDNQRQRLHYLPPGPERAKLRSTTFPGIANAFADQWGILPVL
jgi:hypothetical protein